VILTAFTFTILGMARSTLFSRLPTVALGVVLLHVPPLEGQGIADRYRATASKIIAAALSDSAAYDRLAQLTDKFGHRMTGAPSLEAAIDWILGEMQRDGFENVRGEPVMVPHWVRGEESVELIQPRRHKLHMLGLGRSVGTPTEGITAEVLVVTSFEDLTKRASEARGKIVLFNVPFTTYGQTVQYRSRGASEAARVGALAALVRSITPVSLQSPHTGALRYDSTTSQVPGAAITIEDAEMLARMQKRGEKIVVELKMQAKMLPDVQSRNVVAELRGTEKPEEVVVLGGHIDSWDVGQGAMDDGGGSVAAWEAVRILKKLGLRPRRTVRVVLWTNEESGLRGGKAYRDTHLAEVPKHVAAMESDIGVFRPTGFGVAGPDSAVAMVREIAGLLGEVGATTVEPDGPDADVDPLATEGVPALGLQVDATKYFWYHHTEADTMDKLDPREVAQCVATMAVMAFVLADMPGTLPRAAKGTR
jgi:carboxypeptidase Q